MTTTSTAAAPSAWAIAVTRVMGLVLLFPPGVWVLLVLSCLMTAGDGQAPTARDAGLLTAAPLVVSGVSLVAAVTLLLVSRRWMRRWMRIRAVEPREDGALYEPSQPLLFMLVGVLLVGGGVLGGDWVLRLVGAVLIDDRSVWPAPALDVVSLVGVVLALVGVVVWVVEERERVTQAPMVASDREVKAARQEREQRAARASQAQRTAGRRSSSSRRDASGAWLGAADGVYGATMPGGGGSSSSDSSSCGDAGGVC